MSAKLQYKPLDNIGLNGLNLQANPVTLDPSWLVKADNIVLRESGRISFRKGLKQNVLANTDGTASAPLPIGSIIEHKSGSATKICTGVGTKIYTVDFTTPDSPWTDVFTAGTASDWQFLNFNNQIYGFQVGNPPIKFTSGSWAVTTNKPTGVTTFDPSCGMGYYGRNWVGGITEEKDVVYYSDLLLGDTWTGGSSGVIDLKTVWGTDVIVSINAFYGKLVIFGKHHIAIYSGPSEPTTMSLDEVISGIGCVSRDSVQSVGDDLYFLSGTGVRSLNRTTEKDNLPLQDLSLTIKDTLTRHISQSSNVKAVYVETEGTYILSFVDKNITYVFDIKHETPSGTPRLTTWSFDSNREPSSFTYTESKELLIGQKVGSVATYEGYYDKDYISGGTYTSDSYSGTFVTTWLNLGDSAIAALLKKLKAVISGGSGTIVGLKWYRDFNTIASKTLSFQLNPTTTGTTSLWGASTALYGTTTVTTTTAGAFVIGNYYAIATVGTTSFTSIGASANTVGIVFKATGVGTGTGTAVSHTHTASLHAASSKYAPVYGLKEYQLNLTGSAKFLQIEMSAETKGFVASLQTLTLLYKQGKIR